MYKISFHNHSNYSDGANTMHEMAKAAYKAGFTHYAFTDHNHIPSQEGWTVTKDDVESYLTSIEKLKKEYAGKMKIYSGIEKDWYYKSGDIEIFSHEDKNRLDIIIGSVHLLKGNTEFNFIDGASETYDYVFKHNFEGDALAFLNEYFSSVEEMIRNIHPTLVAHPDIIRIHNASGKYFSEKDPFYGDLIQSLASCMKENSCVTELNGGGDFRHHNGVFYPSTDLLNLCREVGVPITIGLDAHSTKMLTSYYKKSLEMIKHAGYKEIAVFDNGKWKNEDINLFY